jgi:hypothetical protein
MPVAYLKQHNLDKFFRTSQSADVQVLVQGPQGQLKPLISYGNSVSDQVIQSVRLG